MAVNQVSLFFYPPRWMQQLTPDPTTITDEGMPVQIAIAVQGGHATGQPVPADGVKNWLTEQGFAAANWGGGGILERGRVRSMFGFEQEIQIHINEVAGEVVELYCRFTLPRRDPPPLTGWARFMASMCERFGLRLADDSETCDEPMFLAAVRGNRNYQDFAVPGSDGCDLTTR